MAAIATMMGTMVLARVAGSGEFSEEILGAGREAVLGRAGVAEACGEEILDQEGLNDSTALISQPVIAYDIGRVSWKCGEGRIFANAPRMETLSKRRKDCKMPPKPAPAKVLGGTHAYNRTFHRRQ